MEMNLSCPSIFTKLATSVTFISCIIVKKRTDVPYLLCVFLRRRLLHAIVSDLSVLVSQKHIGIVFTTKNKYFFNFFDILFTWYKE